VGVFLPLRIALVPAALLLIAADDLKPADYAADARSIEALVNKNYAYLERFPGERMPMNAKLRAEAEKVTTARELTRFSERALTLLADHHAITGSSLKDSWAVVPSYSDLWVQRHGTDFVIEQVREGSLAEKAGILAGDRLTAVSGVPVVQAVADFWADVGTTGGSDRDGYAARVLAAGRRDRERQLTIRRGTSERSFALPNLYAARRGERSPLSVVQGPHDLTIRFNDSLGSNATIAAFDQAMAGAKPGERIILDLRDTPSGGNTTVARAIMGWFVTKPSSYQVHRLPAEERDTGIPRQWIEQVLPRTGKHHAGPATVLVGRWTGSMGEGLAIGFDALGARVEGTAMSRLLGAVYDYNLERSGQTVKLPTERLYSVSGVPRERFMPRYKINR
jgi:carboxyl-terminal processing protease